MDYWNIIYQISIIVVGLLGGVASVPVIKLLKERLGTTGGQTLALAAFFAALLTLATAVAEQVIAPGTVTADNFGVLFLLLFSAAQARYRQLRDELQL